MFDDIFGVCVCVLPCIFAYSCSVQSLYNYMCTYTITIMSASTSVWVVSEAKFSVMQPRKISAHSLFAGEHLREAGPGTRS